jgi:hypothetical protein
MLCISSAITLSSVDSNTLNSFVFIDVFFKPLRYARPLKKGTAL